MEWNNTKILELIREYRNRPILWDPSHEHYKDRIRKDNALQDIADVFQMDKYMIDRKVKVLLAQYRRERSKLAKMSRTPHGVEDCSGGGAVSPTIWFAYNHMTFLANRDRNRMTREYLEESVGGTLPMTHIKTEFNHEDSDSQFLEDELLLDPEEEIVEEGAEMEDMIENEEPLPSVLQKEPANSAANNINNNAYVKHFAAPRKPPEDLMLVEAYEMMKDVRERYQVNQERDEYTVFGESVAHKIRKLSHARDRCMVQHAINTILYKAEMSSYKESSRGVRHMRTHRPSRSGGRPNGNHILPH